MDSVSKRGQPETRLRGEEEEVGQRGAGALVVGGGRRGVEITQEEQDQAEGQEEKRGGNCQGAENARVGGRIEGAGAPVPIQGTDEHPARGRQGKQDRADEREAGERKTFGGN
ncbi:MAG: hypothetical protein PGMFKBFP_01514 [Anaerolineales bacterium]|nr:hypothetical protein [Anaerolineales bacterium]